MQRATPPFDRQQPVGHTGKCVDPSYVQRLLAAQFGVNGRHHVYHAEARDAVAHPAAFARSLAVGGGRRRAAGAVGDGRAKEQVHGQTSWAAVAQVRVQMATRATCTMLC